MIRWTRGSYYKTPSKTWGREQCEEGVGKISGLHSQTSLNQAMILWLLANHISSTYTGVFGFGLSLAQYQKVLEDRSSHFLWYSFNTRHISIWAKWFLQPLSAIPCSVCSAWCSSRIHSRPWASCERSLCCAPVQYVESQLLGGSFMQRQSQSQSQWIVMIRSPLFNIKMLIGWFRPLCLKYPVKNCRRKGAAVLLHYRAAPCPLSLDPQEGFFYFEKGQSGIGKITTISDIPKISSTSRFYSAGTFKQ